MKVLLLLVALFSLSLVPYIAPGAHWGLHNVRAVHTDTQEVTITWTKSSPWGVSKTVLVSRRSGGMVEHIGTTDCDMMCEFVDHDAPITVSYMLTTIYDHAAYGPFKAIHPVYVPVVAGGQ